MTATALDPLFTVIDAAAFTDRHLAALAAGVTAAVLVPGFLTGVQCGAAMAALAALPSAEYDQARVPSRIARFGPALNDFRRQPGGQLDAARYWPAAEAARVDWARANLRPDPVAVALARLGAAWGTAVTPATIGGRPVFGGTLREINDGALVHYDEIVREYPDGLFDQQLTAQLAFNLWVLGPDRGGETVIWRRRWQPPDEQHRDHYGYQPAVVEGCQNVSLRPATGDALLFNPANLHAVTPNPGQRRVATAFFLGLTTTGNLVAWS